MTPPAPRPAAPGPPASAARPEPTRDPHRPGRRWEPPVPRAAAAHTARRHPRCGDPAARPPPAAAPCAPGPPRAAPANQRTAPAEASHTASSTPPAKPTACCACAGQSPPHTCPGSGFRDAPQDAARAGTSRKPGTRPVPRRTPGGRLRSPFSRRAGRRHGACPRRETRPDRPGLAGALRGRTVAVVFATSGLTRPISLTPQKPARGTGNKALFPGAGAGH